MSDTPEAVGADPALDQPMTVIQMAEELRQDLKIVETKMRVFAWAVKSAWEPLYDKGECIAQAMLALRHVEDARMRCGKVIQYADTTKNGESSYQR